MAFVSMCSGLFYAKLTRLLGEAQVTFSSTLCVQYGKGLIDAGNRFKPLNYDSYKDYVKQVSDPTDNDDDNEEVYVPFPVLEFRVINNRANMTHGQNEIFDAEITAMVQISLGNDSAVGGDENGALPSRWTSAHTSTGDKKNQKVYYTLSFKPSFNPYFNRVWMLQHTLDSTSPLLRREIRKELRLRGKDAGRHSCLYLRCFFK